MPHTDRVLLCGGGEFEIVRGPIKIALSPSFSFPPFHVSTYLSQKYGSSVDSQSFPSLSCLPLCWNVILGSLFRQYSFSLLLLLLLLSLGTHTNPHQNEK